MCAYSIGYKRGASVFLHSKTCNHPYMIRRCYLKHVLTFLEKSARILGNTIEKNKKNINRHGQRYLPSLSSPLCLMPSPTPLPLPSPPPMYFFWGLWWRGLGLQRRCCSLSTFFKIVGGCQQPIPPSPLFLGQGCITLAVGLFVFIPPLSPSYRPHMSTVEAASNAGRENDAEKTNTYLIFFKQTLAACQKWKAAAF